MNPSDQSPETATRRDFLKTSALTGVGAALVVPTGFSSSLFAGGDDTVKVGLIGCGGRGTGAAGQALSTNGNVKLTAVGDAFPENARGVIDAVKGGLGAKGDRVQVKPENIFDGLDAYQKVIDSGVDLVILATPPGFRPIHFEYAVKAGKHVFMEKPVAVDAPGVRQVIEANKLAREKKLKVGVGLQRHHQAGYLETIKRIKDGAIGDIVAMRAYWNGGGVWDPRKTREQCKTEMEYQVLNWYYYNWLSGDHICEQHIHNLDVCNWVAGGKDHEAAYPVKANGMGGRQVRTDKKYGEIFDHHFVEYEYANGSRLYSQCRHIRGCWDNVSEFVHGTKGSSNPGGSIQSADGNWNYSERQKDPYQVEHDDLFAAIRKGAEYNEADNGAYSSMTSILGRLCTYSGKEITWDDAIKSNVSLAPKSYAWDAETPVKANADGVYPIAVPGLSRVL
ncbi:MAG: twin-arginine translocation signal domain-containing protein [Planctomycetota bacterium]|jgi:predicted dehydrogenase|nr:MAG: twin-arginine translocation signal domain-containing protein [Planctomycetota bacterium]